jgi:hypothetical protein
MFEKKVIVPHKVRKISNSFSFIPHRFMRDGFWSSLSSSELLLYLFLVTVSDNNGMSYYGSKKICSLLYFSNDEYVDARDRLIARKLIAHDNVFFQVLELPAKPVKALPEKCIKYGVKR